MEQRRLRLGDILDDYCPRERRVTNHAVVAMIEEDVKQTRCTTCDAEHAYKGGREPRRRKKDATSVLYREVLAGMPEVEGAPALAAPAGAFEVPAVEAAVEEFEPAGADAAGDAEEASPLDEVQEAEDEAGRGPVEDGPIHRRLIRATLPRPEGHKVERQVPDFSFRGNGSFRGDRMKTRGHGGPGMGSGNGTGNGPRGRRFSGGGQGMPGMPGGRGPGGPGRGPGGRPGFGGPSAGAGRNGNQARRKRPR